jgi:hypothetical protein
MTEIWFYKGTGKLFDKLIRWWTKSPYSHCEIVTNQVAIGADAWRGRVIARDVNTFNRANWDIVSVSVADNDWLLQQVGKRYDYLGILGFLLLKIEKPAWWYCSELAAAYLGISKRPISPGELYDNICPR